MQLLIIQLEPVNSIGQNFNQYTTLIKQGLVLEQRLRNRLHEHKDELIVRFQIMVDNLLRKRGLVILLWNLNSKIKILTKLEQGRNIVERTGFAL